MEILELVNQDNFSTEERPFACTFAGCNKTFGMFFGRSGPLGKL